uniref:Transport and golgi organization 6 homolog n=1 Tax=Sinocyclocheilus grahami TaxID=75366 RepID=A0A672PNT2_SINGR
RFLLFPLLSPLHRCAEGTGYAAESSSRCYPNTVQCLLLHQTKCLSFTVSVHSEYGTIFLKYLFVFELKVIVPYSTPCQEILIWFLSHSEHSVALSSLLKRLCGLLGEVSGVRHGFQFSPGSEGGARLTVREPISDEGDALYEKVSGEQWRVQCLVQLLGEMKDSDLPGEFFLLLLQDLTAVAAEREEVEQEVDTSSMTLLELEQHLLGHVSGHGQRLALLQVLAIMCEAIHFSFCIQVVGFIVSMLQRACVSLKRGTDSPVESQTLSMGMGLTAGGIPDCGNSEPSSSKAFSEWLLEACDPDVPSRAVALRSLTRSVRDRDKEALQNKDKLLTLFLENLEHEDSFVYLSAIQGNSFISLRKKST